jgi:caffeoyl-CoA O-methyltransferase
MKSINYFQGGVVDVVRRLFAVEDDALAEARRRAEGAGVPLIEIAPEDGAILGVIVALAHPRLAVEIGTLFGYSGTWIARSLPPGGRLITLEANPDHARVAQRTFEEAGVADRVEIIVGDAADTLAKVTGPVDLVFIDADKTAYPDYLAWARGALRPGGVVLADNSLDKGRIGEPEQLPRSRAVRAFLDQLSADPAWQAAMIPTLEGLAFGVRTEAP